MADRTRHGAWLGVRPAGRGRATLQRRLRIGSAAALALGAAALLAAALWPLPAPPEAEVPEPASASAAPASGDGLPVRERRLRALVSAGNIFAPDREPWPDEAPEEIVVQEEPVEETPPLPPAVRPLPPESQEIALTERPSAAAQQSRDQLTLRGLLVSGGRKLAMIQGGVPRERDRVELYREGEVFLKETWRLVRIDDRRDRIILEHLGQGDVMELSLYDAIATIAAVPEPADQTSVTRATEIDARRQMLDAGVERDDVDQLFDMMARLERGEDVAAEPIEDGEPEDDRAAAAPAPERPETGPSREMPPGLAELLQSMMRDAARSRTPEGGEDKEPADQPEGGEG